MSSGPAVACASCRAARTVHVPVAVRQIPSPGTASTPTSPESGSSTVNVAADAAVATSRAMIETARRRIGLSGPVGAKIALSRRCVNRRASRGSSPQVEQQQLALGERVDADARLAFDGRAVARLEQLAVDTSGASRNVHPRAAARFKPIRDHGARIGTAPGGASVLMDLE